MLIIDYNGIAIGNIVSQKVDIDENLIRHMILNSIRMYRQKFKKYSEETIIVSDGGGNWRKELYPEYKANRKKSRDESSMDWDEVFRITNLVFDEIKENMPYKVLKIWGCEADDTIAQIVYDTQEFGNHTDVMIISADKDFIQLHTLGNVSQFSPVTKRLVKNESPADYFKFHILNGDNGDGVPNVLSDDKVLVEGRRQNTLSAKRKESLLVDPKSMGEEVYRNYLRNKKMIDLSECPSGVIDKIMKEYKSQDPWHKKGKVFPYFVSKKCVNLLEKVQEFL